MPVLCPVCETWFRARQGLGNHMARVHPGVLPEWKLNQKSK